MHPHQLVPFCLLLGVAACSNAQSGEPDGPRAADASPDGRTDAPPGLANAVLNEVYKKQPGTDFHELVEIHGDPATDYADLTILVIESDAGPDAGTIDLSFPVGTTNADGLFVSPFQEEALENGSLTVLLVAGFTGTLAVDLDDDDDGAFDQTPWTAIIDSVALTDDPAAVAYSPIVLAPDFDGGTDEIDGAARIPDGTDTGSVTDWVRHDPEGNGLQDVPGAGGQLCTECGSVPATAGLALITPGAQNQVAQIGALDPLINEVYKKQPGTDFHEFVEIVGSPATDYSTYTIVVLEGDAGTGAGTLDRAYPVGTTNPAGLFVTPFVSDEIENGSMTVLLVTGYTGTLGTDLDPNDDGTLDTTAWTAVIDSVAIVDDPAAIGYSPLVIGTMFDGGSEEPDGVARMPDGTDTGAVTDWVRHDLNANGLAGVPGAGGALCTECGVTAAVAGTALVTPGASNHVAP